MKEEKRITYQAGITRTPSDFLCKDGDLAECINLTTDHEELKPIVQPALKIEIGVQNLELAYVHRHNNTARYIMKDASNIWWTLDPSSDDLQNDYKYMMAVDVATLQLQSIGNTLVVSSSSGMGFFLWKGGEYRYLGARIPDIGVEFSLSDFGYLQGADENPDRYGRVPGMHGIDIIEMPTYQNVTGNAWGSEEEAGDRKWDSGYESGKQALVGIVSSQLEWVKEKKRFAFPFWARSAVRLYDGRHVCISNPFLLLPTVLNNWHIFACDDATGEPMPMTSDAGGWWKTAYRPYCAKLRYRTVMPSFPSGQSLTDWQDIISGVDIFVSEEVKSFDLDGGWRIINNAERPDALARTLCTADGCQPGYSELASMPILVVDPDNDDDVLTWQTFYQPSLLTEGEMTHRLLEQSVFYKIIELNFNEMSDTSLKDATDKIDRGVLKNLVNNRTLKNDDYFSRCTMTPQVIKAYNNRLHMADVSRGFFGGFTRFSYTAHTNSQDRDFYVFIRTEDGTKVVKAGAGSYEIGDVWFYYPDPRAFKAEVWVGSYGIYSLSLKEHPRLNGAYYFGHLPGSYGAWPGGTYIGSKPAVSDDPELLEGRILVSEVDNPWVYTSLGSVTVGMGAILGMASQTVALGQEEHGIHPLIVFSQRGISVLRLKGDGVYERSDELSREVCINPSSVIETDGAVFFASKKGLMVVVGDSVRCVSGQINGKVFDYNTKLSPLASGTEWEDMTTLYAYSDTFLEYLCGIGTFMAYDYVDSRIHIIKPSYSHEYVYNIADGTISKAVLPVPVTSAVNDYPDYLLNGFTERTVEVEGEEPATVFDQKVYSFYDKPHEEDVDDLQLAFLLTRPMKLAGPVGQASLRELMNVGVWDRGTNANPKSCVKTEVYVSDDLQKWHFAGSRFGAAARYYRLALYLKMKPSERLSGTVVTEQDRRGNNMR